MKDLVIVDQTVFPRRKNGNIDWENSVGLLIPFYTTVGKVFGNIEILEYFPKTKDKHIHLTIGYKNRKTTISSSTLISGKFIQFINGKKTVFKREIGRNRYSVGQIIDLGENQKFRILSFKIQTPMKSDNKTRQLLYYVECLDCGYRYWKNDDRFTQKKCPNCTNQVTDVGRNDIVTTDPWMVQYFQGGIDEAKQYRAHSNKIITPICPTCHRLLKPIAINSLYQNHGASCQICSDGIPYPEKFFSAFLNQLQVDYIFQASSKQLCFDTCGKRYDFYIPKIKCLIETHGGQHYEFNNILKLGEKTLEDEQKNDSLKEEMAIKNGYKYIVIDCRTSSINWIKKSIMLSDLPKLLKVDISKIDWNKCGEEASTSLKRTTWNLYNQYYYDVNKLASIVNLSKHTVVEYLKSGNEIGACMYDSHLEKYSRPIVAIKDGEIILSAKNATDMADKYNKQFNKNISRMSISAYITKRVNNPFGLTFEYVTDRERRREILYGDS